MKKRYLLILFVLFLAMLVVSCTTEAIPGVVLAGRSFIGLSSDGLHSTKNQIDKNVNLAFFSNHKAKLRNRDFYYYDSPITEANYAQLRDFLYTTVLVFMEDPNDPDSTESKELTRTIFEELMLSNCFVLSTKELETIQVDLDKEEFNFNGYVGLKCDAGDGDVIYLISTKNVEKGYIFG